jgi:rhodanese-related sulfurtransferase
MSRLSKQRLIQWLSIVVVGVTIIGCEDENRPLVTDKFEVVRSHMGSWLTEAGDEVPIKSSSFLKETVIDDWDKQDDYYQIISVREADDYTNAGHIPNAINIFWKGIVNTGSLSQISTSKSVIVYCYTGHSAMVATTLLGLLDYEAFNLKFGMMDWNLDALNKSPWDMVADYPVETTVNTADGVYALPTLESAFDGPKAIIKERAAAYLPAASPFVSASTVKDKVDNWENEKSDFQIISVRSVDKYEAGHVPHAINISWKTIADVDNLKKIDPEKTTIDMVYGMMDWNKNNVADSIEWDGVADYPVN